MKTGLVLSGGGARGSFQIGVMSQLYANGFAPDVIYGSSVGALNGTGVSYFGIQGAIDIWLSVTSITSIFQPNWFTWLLAGGLFNHSPIRKTLTSAVQNRPVCEVVVSKTNLEDGLVYYTSNKNVDSATFVNDVCASISIPVAVEPVDSVYVDGGVKQFTPLKKAIEDGCDKIIVILCWPWKDGDFVKSGITSGLTKIFNIALRSFQLVEREIMKNDVLLCLGRNSDPNRKKIDLTVYAAPMLENDVSDLSFSKTGIQAAIDAGKSAQPVASLV